MSWTAAQKREKRREYDRLYRTGRSVRGIQQRLVVPDDVERVEVHAPCFNCGDRGACRHRPWVLA